MIGKGKLFCGKAPVGTSDSLWGADVSVSTIGQTFTYEEVGRGGLAFRKVGGVPVGIRIVSCHSITLLSFFFFLHYETLCSFMGYCIVNAKLVVSSFKGDNFLMIMEETNWMVARTFWNLIISCIYTHLILNTNIERKFFCLN